MYDKIKVLTFANNKFVESQKKLSNHLTSIGIKNQINLSDDYLPQSFINEYNLHFSEKRGFGYWIWKPYIISKELEKLNPDEILIYIDSTDLPKISFFNLILNHFESNQILLINRGGYIHGDWTKRDCFIYMDCDEEKYYKELQIDAGVIGVKNNEFCFNLLENWFSFMKKKSILDDTPNTMGYPNLPNFKEHRHDQSILTNLMVKNNIKSININSELMLFNYNQPNKI